MTDRQVRLNRALSACEFGAQAAQWVRAHNVACDAPYHNVFHTETVAMLVAEAAAYEGLDSAQTSALVLAALFHDSGHSAGALPDAQNIEQAIEDFWVFASATSAMTTQLCAEVIRLIRCTQYPYVTQAEDTLSKIMRDADLMQVLEENWQTQVFVGLHQEMQVSKPGMTSHDFIVGCSRFYAGCRLLSQWGKSKEALFHVTAQERCLEMLEQLQAEPI